MIKLPGSTQMFKQMPKENFIKYLNDSPSLEMKFMREIDSIVWINQLSPETMTINPGEIVTEIAVVEIFLKRQVISQNLIEIVNREIDLSTVFIIRYEDWGQIWCSNNESSRNRFAEYQINPYYQTSWLPYDELELNAVGEDLDQVYENFLMQITGKPIKIEKGTLQNDTLPNETVAKTAEPVELQEAEDLEAVIKNLEIQIHHEPQFKQKLTLMVDLINAKKELQKINAPHIMTHMEIVQTDQSELLQSNIEMIQSFFPHVFVNMMADNGNETISTNLKTLKMP